MGERLRCSRLALLIVKCVTWSLGHTATAATDFAQRICPSVICAFSFDAIVFADTFTRRATRRALYHVVGRFFCARLHRRPLMCLGGCGREVFFDCVHCNATSMTNDRLLNVYSERLAPFNRFACKVFVGDLHGINHLWKHDKFLCDEGFVGKSLPGNRSHEAIEPFHRVTRHVAVIAAERKFIDVGAKVFWAGVVIDADQAPLHDSENGLDTVRCHAVADVFAVAVIDGVVVKKQSADTSVRKMLVSVQRRSDFDVLNDGIGDCPGVGRIDLDRFGAPTFAALFQSKHRRLADRAATQIQLLVLVFVCLDTTDIGFVDFDNALQFGQVIAAGFAKPVQNKPRRLLRDADFLAELQARNSFPRCDQKVHRVDPLVQRNVAALEYGARAHGKILPALVAPVEAALAGRQTVAKATNRAGRTIRPKPPLKVCAGRFNVRKHGKKLESRDCGFGHETLPWLPSLCSLLPSLCQGSYVYNSLIYANDHDDAQASQGKLDALGLSIKRRIESNEFDEVTVTAIGLWRLLNEIDVPR